ncbi:unnamed protein product, partial [Nesidiocoris tenuis]
SLPEQVSNEHNWLLSSPPSSYNDIACALAGRYPPLSALLVYSSPTSSPSYRIRQGTEGLYIIMTCSLFFLSRLVISESSKRRRRSPSKGRDTPPEISSSTPGEETAAPNPLLQDRSNCEELRHVVCHLETKDLWEKFNDLGTEMIITKTGRSKQETEKDGSGKQQLKDSFCTTALNGDEIPLIQDLLSFLSTKVETVRNVSSQPPRNMMGNFAPPLRRNRSPDQRSRQRNMSPFSDQHLSFLATDSEEDAASENMATSAIFSQGGYRQPSRDFRPGRSANNIDCFYCHKDHFIYRCPEWLNLDPDRRSLLADRYRLCTRCLSNRHTADDCPSTRTCAQCGAEHHTTLHHSTAFGRTKGTDLPHNDQSFQRSTMKSTKGRLRSPSPSLRASSTIGCSQRQNSEQMASSSSPRPDQPNHENVPAGSSHLKERDLLRILWRPHPELPIQDFRMNTVTYGTASAPFLANRVIRTISEVNKEQYPLASDILANRTYVDDCHGGGSSIESALEARSQMIDSLSSAKFELRKWASNHPDLLKGLPTDHLLPLNESVDFRFDDEKSLKILGLSWNPTSDSFHFAVSPIPEIRTKRELASQIGRVFDPLGWIMPVAVKARTIQRAVCLAGYDWDDVISAELQAEWTLLAKDFPKLQSLRIPRHVTSSSENDWLIGFADASEQAYAAVLYHDCWRHVRTDENPADLASRGALPSQLAHSEQWWSGPTWFSLPPDSWPAKRIRPDIEDQVVAQERRLKSPDPCVTLVQSSIDQFECTFSNYSKLRRTVAWSLRFIHNSSNPANKRSGPLTAKELQESELRLVRRAQQQYLSSLIFDVKLPKPKNRITKSLGLFIDSDNTLRVGGRLSNSTLSFQSQHPALLPQEAHLTRLIISSAHDQLLHVGPRTTLAWLRQRFWIVNGRNVVQRLLASCTKCFSIKPTPFQPEMGHLPSGRTSSIYPFNQTGIDYAGPFDVSITGHRGSRVFPIYLAVFVCFATKAIHLEPVMDLSTDGLLQALERFVSRRGTPAVIWTDNGRNFVGAANLLRPLREAFDNPSHRRSLVDHTSGRGIDWKFIPPRAPHFGGLWEAAVKSAKRLLRVTLRGHTPSYQTFSTLIVRVEAILNSRPLAADLSSPNELRVITPGHFLVQRPLTALPEPSEDVRHSFIASWRFVQQSSKTFWKRWQREYLLEQQQRLKWNTPARPARVGQVVLIQEDNSSPLQWPLGVITELIPGVDKKNRVAVVKTSNGNKTRPLVRLCPFPDPPLGVALAGEDVQPSAEVV